MNTFCMVLISLIAGFYFTACTLSFTNVSTHGTATDTIDETNTPSARLEVPLAMRTT